LFSWATDRLIQHIDTGALAGCHTHKVEAQAMGREVRRLRRLRLTDGADHYASRNDEPKNRLARHEAALPVHV
jgi:hypothetical protein